MAYQLHGIATVCGAVKAIRAEINRIRVAWSQCKRSIEQDGGIVAIDPRVNRAACDAIPGRPILGFRVGSGRHILILDLRWDEIVIRVIDLHVCGIGRVIVDGRISTIAERDLTPNPGVCC